MVKLPDPLPVELSFDELHALTVAVKRLAPTGDLASALAKLESVSDAYIDTLGYMDHD